jgi:hypothetical protein
MHYLKLPGVIGLEGVADRKVVDEESVVGLSLRLGFKVKGRIKVRVTFKVRDRVRVGLELGLGWR